MRAKALIALAAAGFLAAACSKTGDLLPNALPDTFLAIDTIVLSGENRLNSRVHLHWYGIDPDGYVEAYEFSLDGGQIWEITDRQDSVFRFSLPPGQDTNDVVILIRAIDNLGERDQSPARLRIPIKNTPPQASFEEKSLPQDTVRIVSTFRWNFEDRDGNETVNKAYLKANNGPWLEIDRSQFLVSLVINTQVPSGAANAEVYYGTNTQPSATLEGLLAEDLNTLYIKVQDLAGAESLADTSNAFYIKQKTSDLLVVGGQPASVKEVYLGLLNDAGLQYDLEDYRVNNAANAPKFWNPTFRLLVRQYSKMFVYTDPSTLPPNPVSGEEEALLSLAAPAIQQFTDLGGKSFTTTSFTPNADITTLIGAFPIDGLVVSPGQARVLPDSGLFSIDAARYPDVFPSTIDIGVDPFIRSADAENFYRGRLTKLSGWNGDNLVAALRRRNGNVNQVFFSIELHKYAQNRNALLQLFDQVFNDDFNW